MGNPEVHDLNLINPKLTSCTGGSKLKVAKIHKNKVFEKFAFITLRKILISKNDFSNCSLTNSLFLYYLSKKTDKKKNFK